MSEATHRAGEASSADRLGRPGRIQHSRVPSNRVYGANEFSTDADELIDEFLTWT